MNIDIIALATKCGFSTVEDRTIYLSKYSKEKLHDCILKLATLLEAEIRKEYEAEIEQWKCNSKENKLIAEQLQDSYNALAEQNAKLMEALEKSKAFIGEITTFGGKYQYLNGTQIISDAYAMHRVIDAALTPQEPK